ncbi:MAG: acetyl-CoA carboxylase biotin carboxyl carrier protein [Thermosulfidibacteraceae bacterium]|jgi:acetyl-CoA carboxylase biotin carboxyl carrier protein
MDYELIEKIVELFSRSGLTDFEYEENGVRIILRRQIVYATPQIQVVPIGEPQRETIQTKVSEEKSDYVDTKEGVHLEAESSNLVAIRAPLVGTFYRAPAPDAPPYVKEGDVIEKGQVVCIIEAMKIMNEIESDIRGRVVKVLAENGKPVEYGQPLFLVEPL